LLCVKHWFKELDDPQAAAGPSRAFADTPIGQSLLKLDESQRKRLESLFNTAYGVVKAGKPFSDYELICEIQVVEIFYSTCSTFPEHSRQRRPKEIYLSMSFEMFSFVSPYHT
jgi:hypothetical protein